MKIFKNFTSNDYIQNDVTTTCIGGFDGVHQGHQQLMKSANKFAKDYQVVTFDTLPKLYFNRWSLFDFVAEEAINSRPFYEYGVWRGEAFRYLIKTFKKGYGFDTFEGLPEAWHNNNVGIYSSDGNVPKIDGGEFVVGKFEDTLPQFFSVQRPMASVINFDADLYSSTICALNYSKPVIDTNTILVFDEFLINAHWEEDEYKALEEFCSENNFSYKVLAVSFFTKQVAVRLIKDD